MSRSTAGPFSPLVWDKGRIEGACGLCFKPYNEKWDTLRPQELCRISQMPDTVPDYKCAILEKCFGWSREPWATDFGNKFAFCSKVTLMKNWMIGSVGNVAHFGQMSVYVVCLHFI